MTYALRASLSFCEVGGSVLFLDVDNDRYFRLPQQLEQDFLEYQRNGRIPSSRAAGLLKHKILTSADSVVRDSPQVTLAKAARSAMELAPTQGSKNPRASVDVLYWVLLTRLKLRTFRLRSVLERLDSYRRKMAGGEDRTRSHDANHLLAAAADFRRDRIYVPVDTRCLLDSIAMTAYLAQRGHYASVVFGVTDEPFSAHCWSQAGDIVLNDTLGHVESHTRIRVV